MSGLTIIAAACGPQLALAVVLLCVRYIARRRRSSYSLVNDLERCPSLLIQRIESVSQGGSSDKGQTSGKVDRNCI